MNFLTTNKHTTHKPIGRLDLKVFDARNPFLVGQKGRSVAMLLKVVQPQQGLQFFRAGYG